MLPVRVAIAAISVAAFLAFRWFERYRYSDNWRTSEFRGVAFGFLVWCGVVSGRGVPPPPQAKVEFAPRAEEPEPPRSGGAALPNQAADHKQWVGRPSAGPAPP